MKAEASGYCKFEKHLGHFLNACHLRPRLLIRNNPQFFGTEKNLAISENPRVVYGKCECPKSKLFSYNFCLLLQLEPWGVRGASHQPAVMSDRRTIIHTFYSLIYPVDEGNEDVGSIYFGVNKASSLGQRKA